MNWFKSADTHEYATVLFNLPEKYANMIFNLQKFIEKEDVDTKDGMEDEPHVTVLYGLKNKDKQKVIELLKNQKSISIKFGDVSIFEANESRKSDVIKIEIESDELMELNKLVKTIPHYSTYKDYIPHSTIAYVKPGKGKKYVSKLNKMLLDRKQMPINTIFFADEDETKTEIKLK